MNINLSINELLADATLLQRKWVFARITSRTDAEAARIVGVTPATVCRWANKDSLDAAVNSLLQETQDAAVLLLKESLIEAARIKVAGLDSRREDVRQAAASDILDRGLGKATQRQEVTGAAGAPLELVIVERIVDAAERDTTA